MAELKERYQMVILWEKGTGCTCDIRDNFFCRWDNCKSYGINIHKGTVEPLEK